MIGNILLTLGLLASVFSGIMYFLTFRGYENTLKPARIGFQISAFSVLIASGVLLNAILTHQYQYRYVYNYSNDDLPLGLLMSTFYAGQEGSFMIWLLFNTFVGLVLINYTAKRKDLEPRVMFTFTLSTFFLLVMVNPLLKSPFTYIWQGVNYIDAKNINAAFFYESFLQNFILQDSNGNFLVKMSPQLYAILKTAGISISDFIVHGRGLNPLLQNFWMQIHPPMLFVGFALTTVPFAFAMAALIGNDYKDWVKQSLPWTLAAMMVLGLAIMLGGYWSYGVLGWGGYWGWDPVENSSLIPWLVGVALIHTMLIQRRSQLKEGGIGKYARSNLVLAILTYLLVLYSTFLTRSGILGDASVHSFVAPGKMVYFFLLLFIFTFLLWSGISLAVRWKYLENNKAQEDPFLSRELALFTGASALLASGIIVFVGTSAPIFGTSVETRFYDQMNLPIAIIIGLLNGLSILLSWGANKKDFFLKKLFLPVLLSVVATVVLFFVGMKSLMDLLLAFSSLFAIFTNGDVLLKILCKKFSFLGPYVAHIGVGLFFLGVISTGNYTKTKNLELAKNVPQEAFGHTFTFTGYTTFDRDQKFKFNVKVSEGEDSTVAKPVMYFSEFNNELMREPFIVQRLTKDIYITPIGYQTADSNGETLNLTKGETKVVNGVEFTFLDFYRSKSDLQKMQGGSAFSIGAKIKVVKNGKTFVVIPKYQLKGEEENLVPAEVPELNLKLFVRNIDASGSVVLLVTDLKTNLSSIRNREIFTVEVSIKPFVNLLWFGVLIITLGFLISTVQRTRETREAA